MIATERVTNLGCPVARTAQIMGNKWTPLILRDLADGHKRFSELERSLRGISPKTLSERLRKLEEAAVVERTSLAEVPPRVEYELTRKAMRCCLWSKACGSSAWSGCRATIVPSRTPIE